jgi:hypothetical protein
MSTLYRKAPPYSLVVYHLLPLIDALEAAGWQRGRVHRVTPRRDRVEWWELPDGQCIRVEFEGEAFAVGADRSRTMEFLRGIDTSSDEAIARAAGCWTDAQISAARSEAGHIYRDRSRSVEERAEGVMLEMRAVYQRDLRAWAGMRRVRQDKDYQHLPDEATYAAHWLAANSERFDPEVVAVLKRRYPLRTRPHIKPGSTQFHPQPVGEKPRSSRPSRRTV